MAKRADKDWIRNLTSASLNLAEKTFGASNVVVRDNSIHELGAIIHRFIGAALDHPEVFDRINQFSHHHVNGFYRIVLIQSETLGPRIRLHHWPRGFETYEDIHSHNWPFISYVLQGGLTEEIYEESGSNTGLFFHHTKTSSARMGSSEYKLNHLGGAYYRKVSQMRRNIGSIYSRSAQELHRIAKVSPCTTTLFCTGSYVSDRSTVLKEDDFSTTVAVPEKIGANCLRSCLESVYHSNVLTRYP